MKEPIQNIDKDIKNMKRHLVWLFIACWVIVIVSLTTFVLVLIGK